MYGFGGVGLSEVQNSISELSVVGGWWVGGGGGLDKRTSWSDLHRVRQKTPGTIIIIMIMIKGPTAPLSWIIMLTMMAW